MSNQQIASELTDQQVIKAIGLFEKQSRVYIDINGQDRKSVVQAALRSVFTNPKYNHDSSHRLAAYLQLELNSADNQPPSTSALATASLSAEFQLKLSKDTPQNNLVSLLQELTVATVDPITGGHP